MESMKYNGVNVKYKWKVSGVMVETSVIDQGLNPTSSSFFCPQKIKRLDKVSHLLNFFICIIHKIMISRIIVVSKFTKERYGFSTSLNFFVPKGE